MSPDLGGLPWNMARISGDPTTVNSLKRGTLLTKKAGQCGPCHPARGDCLADPCQHFSSRMLCQLSYRGSGN